VIFQALKWPHAHVVFESRSGLLPVRRADGTKLVLDFPARPPRPVQERPRGLSEALHGSEPAELLRADYWMAVYQSEREVAELQPDFRLLAQTLGELIVTAPAGNRNPGMDFVSRFFGPGVGIDEDPVTGSAHCILTPYWANRLGKVKLKARQISTRGGVIECELVGKRVELAGHAEIVMTGEMRV
jgi:predicted PhzF superfamily epimerase YddE/YHI9